MILTNKQTKWLTLIVLFTIALIQGLYMLWTPWQLDDFWFLSEYIIFNDGDTAFNLDSFINTRLYFRANDNSRLANILELLTLLTCPKWLFSIITGIVTAGLFYVMTRIVINITGRDTKPLMPIVLVLLWWLTARHSAMRYVVAYADLYLNYVYSAFFIFWTALILDRAASERMSRWSLAGSMLVAFAAGWFHEGLSTPLMAGIGLWACVKRFKMPHQWWIIVVAFVLGFLIVITSPGIHSRANSYMWPNIPWHKTRFIMEWCLRFILPLALILLLIALTRPGRRLYGPLIRKQSFVLVAVICATAFVIAIATPISTRTPWLPALSVFIILAVVIIRLMPWWRHIMAVLYIAGTLTYVYNIISMGMDLKLRHRSYLQSIEVHRLFDAAPHGTVFRDIYEFDKINGLYFSLPEFDSETHLYTINMVRNDSTKIFTVVPKNLETFTIKSSCRQIPGNLGAVSYNGRYLRIDPEIFKRRDAISYHNENVWTISDINPKEESDTPCFIDDKHVALVETTDGATNEVKLIQKSFVTTDGHLAIWYRFDPEITKPIKKIEYDPVVRR